MDRQLFQHVCDVLDHAGFLMRDGDRGLVVVATSQGVRVGWRPGHLPLRPAADRQDRQIREDGLANRERHDLPDGYGQGIKAAMATAVAAVLEQAGLAVREQGADLLVTGEHHPAANQCSEPSRAGTP